MVTEQGSTKLTNNKRYPLNGENPLLLKKLSTTFMSYKIMKIMKNKPKSILNYSSLNSKLTLIKNSNLIFTLGSLTLKKMLNTSNKKITSNVKNTLQIKKSLSQAKKSINSSDKSINDKYLDKYSIR